MRINVKGRPFGFLKTAVFVCLFFITFCSPPPETTENEKTQKDPDAVTDENLEGPVENNGKVEPGIESNTTTGTIALGSGVNTSVPKDLAVVSVTAPKSSKAITATASQIAINLSEEGGDANDYVAKIEKFQQVLTTTKIAECINAIPDEFSFAQGNLAHAKCNGPSATYTNHPNITGDFEIGGGDLGMYFDYAEPSSDNSGFVQSEGNTACGARVVDNLVRNVGAYADAALGFQGFVACVARLSGKKLPEVGESLDLSQEIAAQGSNGKSFTMEKVELSSLSTADDKKEVQTLIFGTMKDEPRNLEKDFELKVSHILDKDDNSAYSGVIQFRVIEFEVNEGDPSQSSDALISLKYQWAKKQLIYRYRQLAVGVSSKDLTFSDQSFDSESGELAKPSPGESWTEISVDQDHLGYGKVAFAWGLGGVANVFNAVTSFEAASDGSVVGKGAAYFGVTTNLDSKIGTSDYYKIDGFNCYRNASSTSAFVQKQELELDLVSGNWTLAKGEDEKVKSFIRYAPVEGCERTAPLSGESFTVQLEQGGPGSEVAVSIDFPINNSLYKHSDYLSEWTPPAVPGSL